MTLKAEYKNHTQELILKVNKKDGAIIVHWEGKSTEESPDDFLNPIFKEIFSHEQTPVIMNFTRLQYMNSRTITPLVCILEKIENSTGSVIFQYIASAKWQKLIFDALRLFETKDNRIQIIGL